MSKESVFEIIENQPVIEVLNVNVRSGTAFEWDKDIVTYLRVLSLQSKIISGEWPLSEQEANDAQAVLMSEA